jgi:tetratricopeptide (TPR) repeat protein
MNKDKNKAQNAKPQAAKAPVVKSVPIKVPPLFRKIDWLVLGITFAVIWAAYLWTLAPEVTLEDSGELCTASFYAGIPHPPGYPFWAIYSWLWTVILPIGNVAWRVEVGESFAAAMACGLVGFMVSRGSSMLIEGIEELKNIESKWENAICIVTGIVAGLMTGFDGFLWKESVVINRISPFDVPWLIIVTLCLLRWIYAPHQIRYLFIGMFFFGVCATIHQTMLVAAMGIEVGIILAHRRYGRNFCLGNSIIFLMVLILMASKTIPALNDMSQMFVNIFYVVGVGSIAGYFWLAVHTKETFSEFLRDGCIAASGVLLAAVPSQGSICAFLSLIAFGGFIKLAWDTRKLDLGWLVVIVCGILWACGAAFYLYEPLAGMTDPPMQWGYPRTVEGFFHALSRGQYEKANPTDIIHDPMRFVMQLRLLVGGVAESFSWVAIFIALLPFLFLFKMKNRERSWIIGLTAIYLCVGVLLTIIMNTTPDRASADENKAFFTASHAIVAIMIGYGLALMSAYMATHYERFRRWGLIGSVIAVVVALICLWEATGRLYFGPAGQCNLLELPHWVIQAFTKDQYGLPVFANLILMAVPIIFIIALLVYRQRGPVLILLCLLTAMPVWSGLSHWYKSEQRNHWFGYWFGHDMFTPPFIGTDGKFSYDAKLRAEAMKKPGGDLIYPEMARNAIVFGGTDPGRFCPTYMIFCESFIPHDCQPKQDQNFDRRDCYLITQNALADGTYLDYLRAQYNRSQQIDPPFFREFLKYVLGIPFGENSSFVRGISEASYHLLDVPFTKLGAKIEARRRAEGVYPPNEIYIPSPQDSQDCFQSYTEDVARRQQINQLKPGEDVHVDNGRVQVSGQVAVMMINGLLCKVIFDHNPTNDFYVEESFPLDWMYPYETPSGVIMKINRNPVSSYTSDIFKKDHEFWSKYSDRLVGNWITYDTSVKEIADFAQKVYLGNNYAGFKGDRKFVRDDDAQKAFSKLRSSIAGMYAWRLGRDCPPEYAPKNNAELQALQRETDFAFKQSFAFCPYSPEAVYRYVNFLLQLNRLDDALLVAQTCLKLDPYNGQIGDLIKQLQEFKKQAGERGQIQDQLQKLQTEAANDPTNFQNILALGGFYTQMQDTNRAAELFRQATALFDQELANPNARPANITAMAQIAAETGNFSKLEGILKKLVSLLPNQPEPLYDLAALEAITGKNDDAIKNLRASLDLSSKRLLTNSAARNLLTEAGKDPRFNNVRGLPEFQKLVPAN